MILLTVIRIDNNCKCKNVSLRIYIYITRRNQILFLKNQNLIFKKRFQSLFHVHRLFAESE